jgi:branched-chain amino acid transport system ATP-binding protein
VAEIFKIIRHICQEGVTVLILEQNTKQTFVVCDWDYILENGRIVLSGTGQELLTNDRVKQAYLGI